MTNALTTKTVSIGSAKDLATRVLRSLPSSVTASLREEWIDRYTDGCWDGDFSGYHFEPLPHPKDLDLARMILSRELTPADPNLVDRELGRLRIVTKSRPQDTMELGLVIGAYAEEVGQYPAAAVEGALRKLGRSQVFWPSLKEVIDELDYWVRKPRAILRAIEKAQA